jgi:hypothetical protein
VSSEYVVGDFLLEDSRSRTGRHHAKSIIVIYSRDKGLIPLEKASEYIAYKGEGKPTYVRGKAYSVKLRLRHGDYVLYAWFVKNFLGKVKGYISVYNHRGELVYRAKYYDGILRYSIGNPIYAWLVRLFIDKARIPVRKIRLGDEKL